MVFDCPETIYKVIRGKTGSRYYHMNELDACYILSRKYAQSATASFHCFSCQRSWDSFKVNVTLKFSSDKRNFHIELCGQQCNSCSGEFCKPTLSDSEWSRLVPKFCSVLSLFSAPKRSVRDNQDATLGDVNKPHDSMRCEACRRGVCVKL